MLSQALLGWVYFLKSSFKNKEGMLSEFVDDRKLGGISTKVSDRVGIQSSFYFFF